MLFRRVSGSVGGVFLKIRSVHNTRMYCQPCKLGCDRSLIKGTLLGESNIFPALSRIPLESFPEISYTQLSMHAQKTVPV